MIDTSLAAGAHARASRDGALARLAALLPDDVPAEREGLLDRLERWYDDLRDPLVELYPGSDAVARVIEVIAAGHQDRSPALRHRDRVRLLTPDWFQQPAALGYAAYADRFAGTLADVAGHVDYLRELGVTYLHLMPLLAPRPGPNDGGYAVADYRQVRPDLGTMADLARLATALHEAGIALTLDLVLNHVAREHEWAVRARAGEERYRRYFRLFPDRTLPDAFERTLPEIFPDFAPGSFTWDDDVAAWVWTTFNDYQWDLDWSNPDVLVEFVELVLFLANQGVDCLRLDAIAFLWKRLGTSCQNEPEVHAITQALRTAARIAAPAMIFKAEAIVGPEDVGAYLGLGRHAGRVSDLAYHNSLMVQIWSALATRDVRLMVHALNRFPIKPVTTAWATYVRCHDDIGWAVDDGDAAAVGWDGFAHRRFLAGFYVGGHPGSFARGALFQDNPATGDRRTSGTTASLAGLEAALDAGDAGLVDVALARIFLVHAMIYGFGGVPLLYMGDELGLRNDHSYPADPAHQHDNRWLHRPQMPWDVAAGRHDPTTVAGRVFAGIRHLGAARGRLRSLHAAVETTLATAGNDAVLATVRRHPAGTVVGLYNVSEHWQPVDWTIVRAAGLVDPDDVLNGHHPAPHEGRVTLPPYAAWWLLDREK